MKTLKSVVCTLAIVVSATVVSLSQNNVVAENNSDANKVFLWTSNYMKAFPTEAYAHIGGKIAIKEFLNTKGMEKILVFNGIDSEGSHKVIFKAAYENGLPIEDTDTYDNIRPCPPYCPKEKIAEIGSVIDEGLAFQMIEKFQRNYTSRPKAQLFDKESFEKILAQNGAEGLYIGNAINSNGDQTMILAGVDFYGNVMWDGVVIDNSTPIPAHRDLGYPSQSIVSIK